MLEEEGLLVVLQKMETRWAHVQCPFAAADMHTPEARRNE